MAGLHHRPTKSQSRRLVSSLSLVFLAFVAILLLCPVAVSADEDKKAQYGTVIGIGELVFPLQGILSADKNYE